jgi:hypothetical protein
MNQIMEFLRQLLTWLSPFVIVAPWEQAIRVRAGKHLMILPAGIHLKLPVVDCIYVQSVRLRVSLLDRQTVSTSDGQTLTFIGALGFEIKSIQKLYERVHHAEDTVKNLAMASLALYVSQRTKAQCDLSSLVEHVAEELTTTLGTFGLGNLTVCITDFAAVRTYRLVGDGSRYVCGTDLRTEKSTGA